MEIESVAEGKKKRKTRRKERREGKKNKANGNSKVCEYTSSVLKRFNIASAIFKFFHDARSRNENWILTLHSSSLISVVWLFDFIQGDKRKRKREKENRICKEVY